MNSLRTVSKRLVLGGNAQVHRCSAAQTVHLPLAVTDAVLLHSNTQASAGGLLPVIPHMPDVVRHSSWVTACSGWL